MEEGNRASKEEEREVKSVEEERKQARKKRGKEEGRNQARKSRKVARMEGMKQARNESFLV